MSGGDGVNPDGNAWLGLARDYTVGVHRTTEIVRARLHAHLRAEDAAVREAMAVWPGPAYAHEGPDGVDLVLIRPGPAERPRWWLHALLFLLTLFTTHMAGALLLGFDPVGTKVVDLGHLWLPYPTTVRWPELLRGAPFALPFLTILLVHESGHYLAARRHRVAVTPPFFLPVPAWFSLVGTLGAFIRIKSPMVRRGILLDVGAAGPLASFLLSLPVTAVGMALSRPVAGRADLLTPFVVRFAGESVWIGNGLAVHGLAWLFHPGALGVRPLLLHPMAFAGWLGLFVTALNLLPLGQLDGGHVLYALARGRQRRAARLFLFSLLPLGVLWWGWWLWAVAAWGVNRGRLAHPAVIQDEAPLDPVRRRLALACVVVFFLTMIPVPLRL